MPSLNTDGWDLNTNSKTDEGFRFIGIYKYIASVPLESDGALPDARPALARFLEPGLIPEHPTAVEGCRSASRCLTLRLLTLNQRLPQRIFNLN